MPIRTTVCTMRQAEFSRGAFAQQVHEPVWMTLPLVRSPQVHCITEVLETMRRLESFASIVINSSVMPSAK
jgi:hypothetical protein